MKPKALLMGWLLAGAAVAAELERPAVVGHIANQAGGQITLTMRTSKKCAQQEAVFAYVRDPGGRISLIGCWKMHGEDIFVFWDDGDVFSYPLESVQMTEEWLRWIESQRGAQS